MLYFKKMSILDQKARIFEVTKTEVGFPFKSLSFGLF